MDYGAVSKRVFAALSTALFHSELGKRFYATTLQSRHRPLRTLGMTAVCSIFALRTARLFVRPTPPNLVAGAGLLAAAGVFGPGPALLGALGVGVAGVAWCVARQPEDGIGHRLGASGFHGPLVENTLESLSALLAREAKDHQLSDFPFIEFDIQETKDGELVVFHDAGIVRAFPDSPANADLLRSLARDGVDLRTAAIHDLTTSQLAKLHLGGHAGAHVPTLAQVLDACADGRATRSLAVEVKAIHTDPARERFIELIRSYADRRAGDTSAIPDHLYPPLGWAGVIAFPHLYARAFGEYGSPTWRAWARRFQQKRIPVRCCHFHALSFVYGA